MIHYFTVHKKGRVLEEWWRKYFDPWEPLNAEFYRYEKFPSLVHATTTPDCSISAQDHGKFMQIPMRASQLMKQQARSAVFSATADYAWEDMCQDAGFPPGSQPLALFLFWHQQGILWPSKLFTECKPNPYISPVMRKYKDQI